MKKFKICAWMMATAIACVAATACSLDDNEQEKPFTTCPVEHSKFFAWGIYLNALNNGVGSVIAPVGYANAVLSTAMLLGIFPVIILYVFCQRLFVESLASTGVKM